MTTTLRTLREITIVLEFMPPKELNPNDRSHPAVKRRKARLMWNSGYEHGVFELGDWYHVPRVRLTYTYHHYRKIDYDNFVAMMKSWVDGLVATKLTEDDSPDHLVIGEPKWVRAKKGESRVEIVVEEIP